MTASAELRRVFLELVYGRLKAPDLTATQFTTRTDEIFQAVLSERERMVIRLRFGLGDDGPPCSSGEVAQLMRITTERAGEVEAQAMGKIRAYIKNFDRARKLILSRRA